MLTKITEDLKFITPQIEIPVPGRSLRIEETDGAEIELLGQFNSNLMRLEQLVAKVQFMNTELKGLIRKR